MFAIIRVDQSYDYVEGVQCLACFDTESEANSRLDQLKKERDESWLNRVKYIEKYVEDITLPETDYEGWKAFLKPYPIGTYVVPKEFKQSLKGNLINGYSVADENYKPPAAITNMQNLFVVEVTPSPPK